MGALHLVIGAVVGGGAAVICGRGNAAGTHEEGDDVGRGPFRGVGNEGGSGVLASAAFGRRGEDTVDRQHLKNAHT